MATIVTRSGKGSPLTNTEVDANFTNLNNDKLETNAEVRAAVEAASDSNVFTDADHTKLNAIEANATADQTAAEILTAIKTVDGTGSGLDADTLDGVEAAALLPLSGGTMTGNLSLGDNVKATFGAGDLEIYHDGSNSYIKDAGTGVLTVQSNQVRFRNSAGTEDVAFFNQDAAVKLYYDSAKKFETTSYGTLFTGNSKWADNGKATFGDGDDLQIYHDGSNSFIADFGTGILDIKSDGAAIQFSSNTGELYAYFANNGAAQLFHDNVKKIETTASGIDVTGAVKPTTYQETYVANSTGSTTTLDLATGTSFSVTLSENTTFAFSNPPTSGTAYSFTLFITQPSSAKTIAWPSSVDWAGGSAPDAPGNSEVNGYGFFTRDGGTTYYGFLGGAALG